MRTLLFYLEPAVFRNDPLFLVPHLTWIVRICVNLSIGANDRVVVVSSSAICENARSTLPPSLGAATLETSEVCSTAILRAFDGKTQEYAKDLYVPPRLRIRNTELFNHLERVIHQYDPDVIFSTSENRYLSRLESKKPRRIGTFFMEKAPLPSWCVNFRLYFDVHGHQANSLLAVRWREIIHGTYLDTEMRGAEKFIQEIESRCELQRTTPLAAAFSASVGPFKETILVALQPDDWLSWEGALKTPLHPLDLLEQCCRTFPSYNIVPTIHRDLKGVNGGSLVRIRDSCDNLVVLPDEILIGRTEELLPLVDHVYTVSSATGFSALLYSKNLISDANSYLVGGAVTSKEFLAGARNRLSDAQRINLVSFLISRLCHRPENLNSLEDYRALYSNLVRISSKSPATRLPFAFLKWIPRRFR